MSKTAYKRRHMSGAKKNFHLVKVDQGELLMSKPLTITYAKKAYERC